MNETRRVGESHQQRQPSIEKVGFSHPTTNEWLQLHLGDIVEYGKALKAKADEIEDETWVLELEDIEKNTSVILKKIIFKDRQTKSTKNKFKKGDVLYGKLRPYLNKVVVAEEDGVCSTEILPLSGNIGLNNKYLFYWLKHPTFLEYVTKVGYGVNMPRLGTKDGKAAPFIYAPLAEQKEIATQLDNLLAQVDTLKNRLDAIPVLLKRFRQSVLAAAVSGKLTEDWREGQGVTIQEWYKVKLQDVAKILDPHPSHRTPPVAENGVPYIGIGDLKKDGSIDFLNSRKVSKDILEEHNNRYTLKKGDFVFGKIGTLGKATILPVGIDYTLSANVILIQPNIKVANPTYLMFFLSAPITMEMITNQANSTSQAAFGIKKMRAFSCDIPSLQEQTEIVTHVETLFAFADKIEARLKQAQTQANNLTPSLLAKAFRGDLTADWRKQNPDLITGENSAKALLERIKAEQEKLKPKRKTRKKKA